MSILDDILNAVRTDSYPNPTYQGLIENRLGPNSAASMQYRSPWIPPAPLGLPTPVNPKPVMRLDQPYRNAYYDAYTKIPSVGYVVPLSNKRPPNPFFSGLL